MLEQIITDFAKCRLLVIGDLIADEFVYGRIARISREAPVMILEYEKTQLLPGGAANAAANIAALGGKVTICGFLGKDRSGRALNLSLKQLGVVCKLVTVPGYVTPTKTRILAGLAHSTRQQVIRIDREPKATPGFEFLDRLRSEVAATVNTVDAVVVSDYNYGAIGDDVVTLLRDVDRRVPVLVDSRHRLKLFAGVTAATPNHAELEELLKREVFSEEEVVCAGKQLREELGLKALLLTRGSEGMSLFLPDGSATKFDAVGSLDPVDVTGAGDTVMAAFALAIAAGATFKDAANIANHAGGIVVMKRATATVTQAELLESVRRECRWR